MLSSKNIHTRLIIGIALGFFSVGSLVLFESFMKNGLGRVLYLALVITFVISFVLVLMNVVLGWGQFYKQNRPPEKPKQPWE